jgi:hypothetical protein
MKPHSGRPTEPRLFKIAHFAPDMALMTAAACSALRSSSSRDGIGRPVAVARGAHLLTVQGREIEYQSIGQNASFGEANGPHRETATYGLACGSPHRKNVYLKQ